MKDAPNSSHSSRSATPLMALLQPAPAGDAGIVGGAAGSKVTPQHSPQQQKIVCAREVYMHVCTYSLTLGAHARGLR